LLNEWLTAEPRGKYFMLINRRRVFLLHRDPSLVMVRVLLVVVEQVVPAREI
jgi:hypothetical protein